MQKQDIRLSLTAKKESLIIRVAPNPKAKKEKNISSPSGYRKFGIFLRNLIFVTISGGALNLFIRNDCTFGFNPATGGVSVFVFLSILMIYMSIVSVGYGNHDQILNINKKGEFVELVDKMINYSYKIPFSQIKALRLYTSRYSRDPGSSDSSDIRYLNCIDLVLSNGNLMWIYSEKKGGKSSKFLKEIVKKIKYYLDVAIIDETSSNLSDHGGAEYKEGEREYSEVLKTNVLMLDEDDLLGIKFKLKRTIKHKLISGGALVLFLSFFIGILIVVLREYSLILLGQVLLWPLSMALLGFAIFILFYDPVQTEVAILNNDLLISTKTRIFIGQIFYERKYRIPISNVIGCDISRSNSGAHTLNLIFGENEENQIPKRMTTSIGPPDLEDLKRIKEYFEFPIWTVDISPTVSNINLADLTFIRDIILERLNKRAG